MTDTEPIPLPVADEIRLAAAFGRDAQVLDLIDSSPLQAWFGIRPDEMRDYLDRLPPSLVASSFTARSIRLILNGEAEAPEHDGADLRTLSDLSAHMVGSRLAGSPRRSLRTGATFATAAASINGLFDASTGWRTFTELQAGITQMLAGDMAAALAHFARASATTPPMPLSFLLRDAYVKSAIVHALYGAPWVARSRLEIAESLPRTMSWTEPIISAHAEIAAAVALETDPDAAIDRLERIPAGLAGEMWPFWLEAAYWSYARAGRLATGAARIAELSAATPATTAATADGYPAVIVPLLRGTLAAWTGDPRTARQLLAALDPEQVPVGLVNAYVDVAEGRLDAAIATLISLRARTAPLATWDAVRTVLLALALARRDDTNAALELLQTLNETWRSRVAPWRGMIPPELDVLAGQHIPGWQQRPADVLPPAAASLDRIRLTPREHDVLRLLARGLSREQIARQLFVSPNTVKSQLRSLYRKLGVSSRTAALVQAHGLGLL